MHLVERSRLVAYWSLEIALMVFLSSVSHGQSVSTDTPSSSDSDNGGSLAEIMVTAQKRSESIDRVGMSITAVTGDMLKEQQIRDVSDLANIVPGLSYANSNIGTPVYTLRGVGFYDTSLGAYPTVSVYVDQVPLPFSAMTEQASLDLERVEILKGPQGILFGQNSTGGAINYIAAKPTDDFHAGVELGYGRFNTVEEQGFISGPLAPTLTARLAMSATSGDDWQYNYVRNAVPSNSYLSPNNFAATDNIGKVEKFAVRTLLDWKPTDAVSLELNVNGWIDKSDPEAAQLVGTDPQHPGAPFADPTVTTQPVAPQNDRAAAWSPGWINGNQHQFQTSLHADVNLTRDLTLTSLSSYATYHRDSGIDADGEIAHDQDYIQTGNVNSFTQELRLSNASGSRARWVIGGNLENDIVNENDPDDIDGSQLPSLVGFGGNGIYGNQKMKNYAGFGDLEFDVLPWLTLKGGARYTKADRSIDTCTYDLGNGLLANYFNSLSTLLAGHPPAVPAVAGGCSEINAVTFQPGRFDSTLNQHNVSWRGGVDFRATDKTLLYLNVAKGFKAGSFPVQGASTTDTYQPVVQESVLDYEGGFKTRMLNDRLAVNGALFYYDYTNKQLLAKLIDPIFGVIPALVNVPKSTVKGAELSVDWSPVRDLHLGISGDYLDATVNQFTGVNQNGVLANFADTPMPFTPKWQVVQTGEYRWFLGGSTVFAGYTVNYRSGTNSSVGGTGITAIDGYTTLDLRAGFEPNSSTKVTFWGKNVTDRYYWNNVVRNNDVIVRYAGMPATFGFTVSRTW
jgi:iron complex outermembrane recepter protein